MTRRLAAAVVAVVALVLLPVGALAAQAPGCAWTVDPNPGVDIAISGTRFTPSADVTVTWQRNSAPPEVAEVPTNGNAEFLYTIDAGPGRGGRYHITATDGTCGLEKTDVVAVETAGGGGTLPHTDSEAARPANPAGQPLSTLAGLVAIGAIVGILVLRIGRRSPR